MSCHLRENISSEVVTECNNYLGFPESLCHTFGHEGGDRRLGLCFNDGNYECHGNQGTGPAMISSGDNQ